MKRLHFPLLYCVLAALPIPAQEPAKLAVGSDAQDEMMVTVYNVNYGLVREVRHLNLPAGTIELEFRDVAEKIDASSVAFKSQTAPGEVSILEQNYRYDLLNPQTLLDKFIGQPIQFQIRKEKEPTPEIIDGTLLSTNGGTIVKVGGGIMINPPGTVVLSKVPDELLSKPTLIWLLKNAHAGDQKIETSYLTSEMNWKADYVAIIDANDTKLDLTGWVTLDNKSGATYKNAKLKLVAGDVQRVPEPMVMAKERRAVGAATLAAEDQFAEKSFFEYHLYTLGRATTLANNETKQMTLLEGADVPVKKSYVFDSTPWTRGAGPRWSEKRKLDVVIEFENKAESHLGIALPKGRVRVYKADTDGSQQFIGEDMVDHTPRDEKVRLKMGQAFDIVAERAQTDYKQLAERLTEMGYSVTIRNHKDEDIEATIIEHAYGDWEVTKESAPHKKKDSQTLEFTVKVPKNGEATVTYSVRVQI